MAALRDELGVTGPKYGCGINVCTASTSHLGGVAFNPSNVATADLNGRTVTTIEGLADTVPGDLHPVPEAGLEQDVAQCGYGPPGQIRAVAALLTHRPNLTSTPSTTRAGAARSSGSTRP